jgi:methylated-DNA-protein-cysteine methyltransferase related protein
VAKSPFFARIKTDVLRIVAAIPTGKVITFADVGQHLDVVPRHVAYILTMLSDEEKVAVPWHRVVGESGQLGKPRFNADGVSQAELLEAENVRIDAAGTVERFDTALIAVAKLKSGVPKQTRPADVPAARGR